MITGEPPFAGDLCKSFVLMGLLWASIVWTAIGLPSRPIDWIAP
jgi:hypothetical protein